jgi:hypothetical protein
MAFVFGRKVSCVGLSTLIDSAADVVPEDADEVDSVEGEQRGFCDTGRDGTGIGEVE